MRQYRATFASRLGFYLAAVGSACGLGTLWRFPYLTGYNGGGGFVFLYIFAVAMIGLPVLIAELMLGKMSRSSLMGALTWKPWSPDGRKWIWLARFSVVASFCVLSYYSVVSGWVFYFIIKGISGAFSGVHLSVLDSGGSNVIDELMEQGGVQVSLTCLHVVLISLVVGRGVREGIEKFARFIMPLFFGVVVILLLNSLFLPGAKEAVRYFLYPNFATISRTALIEALGHALFSLSVGFGAMVTYGSYLKDEVHLPSEALLVTALDTLLALCGGLIIFPIVFTAGVDLHAGPLLMFKTLPVLFGNVFLGYWMGIIFFICLYFAAVSGSVAIFEGVVAHFMDNHKMKRLRASILVGAVTLSAASVMSLSKNILQDLKLGEKGLIEIVDQFGINWSIAMISLGVVLFVAVRVPESQCKTQFVNEKNLTTIRLYSTWRNAVRFIVPLLILSTLILQGYLLIRS